jgi:hypothetical protein
MWWEEWHTHKEKAMERDTGRRRISMSDREGLGSECCRPVSRVLALTGQRIGPWGSGLTSETTRSAHKVGFIMEKGKSALRDRQGAQKIDSSLLFTWGGRLFGPFCWGGESGIRGGVVFWHISTGTCTQSSESLLFISLVAFLRHP